MSDVQTCAHEGWGQYPDELGDCPPPSVMKAIDGGLECGTCGFRIQVFSGAAADARINTASANRERAVNQARETR